MSVGIIVIVVTTKGWWGGGCNDVPKNEQRAVQWSGAEKLRNKGMTHATDRQHSTVAILLCICFYGSTFCLWEPPKILNKFSLPN